MTRMDSLMRALRRKFAGMPVNQAPAPLPGLTQPVTQQMPHAPQILRPTGVQNTTQSITAQTAQRRRPHVMGTGIPQTGLPPSKVNAAPLPGAPGGVASNPIEMHGGLGPAGTVDGNHAAGVRKGFKIG